MAIEELARVVVPPKYAVETGNTERWAEIERILGRQLPKDYYDFAMRYGSGRFQRPFDLEVFNPFSESYPDRLCGLSRMLRDERGLSDRVGIPYGVYPDQPGWLLWGTSDGDTFCWITEGNPDAWPILLISDRNRSFQQLRMSMTSFLARVFTGELRPFVVVRGRIRLHQPGQFVASRTSGAFPPMATSSRPATLADALVARPHCPWEGDWLPPDALGRPTGAQVVMGPGSRTSLWNGLAAAEFTAYPAWWPALPEPWRRWRRGQLLGWRLGGPAGAALHNMIPLTWRAQSTLWAIEGGVAMSVLLGARMTYKVQAMYEGANHYPSQVAMEYQALPGSPCSLNLQTRSVLNE
jgi:hypothetical protein